MPRRVRPKFGSVRGETLRRDAARDPAMVLRVWANKVRHGPDAVGCGCVSSDLFLRPRALARYGAWQSEHPLQSLHRAKVLVRMIHESHDRIAVVVIGGEAVRTDSWKHLLEQ